MHTALKQVLKYLFHSVSLCNLGGSLTEIHHGHRIYRKYMPNSLANLATSVRTLVSERKHPVSLSHRLESISSPRFMTELFSFVNELTICLYNSKNTLSFSLTAIKTNAKRELPQPFHPISSRERYGYLFVLTAKEKGSFPQNFTNMFDRCEVLFFFIFFFFFFVQALFAQVFFTRKCQHECVISDHSSHDPTWPRRLAGGLKINSPQK